ncbi:MAG TPA: hypothetical protein VN428_02160 [Bryobacteraceae bacterium]|nr:hypothetical protein [Bryobacteraceae bacterium]
MEIKRVGPGNTQPQGPSDAGEAAGKRFQPAAHEQEAAHAAELPAAGVPEGLTRADLADEKKLNAAVRHCVDQLVRTASEKVDGGLGEDERAHLGEVLQNDPGFRAQVLRYLDQVLK